MNGGYDNGANRAPKSKTKTMRPTKKELEKALEAEKKRSSSLSVKLKKARADNKQLREKSRFDDAYAMPRHSTMREDYTFNHGNSQLATSLSVASLNIPECKPAENEEEIDRKTFEAWKELLEASMDLIGVTDEVAKMNVLKLRAGAKLLEVLEGTPSQSLPDVATAPYSNAMTRLKDFYGSREYNLVQRQRLRAMVQAPKEGDTKYVKRVIAAAKLCDFDGDKLAECVAEVIQMHVFNIKVREAGRKMLRKGGSLPDLVDKVRGYELDRTNEEIFAKTHPPAEAFVAAVAHKPTGSTYQRSNYRGESSRGLRGRNFGYPGRAWQDFRSTGGYQRRNDAKADARDIPCWRCTSRFHLPANCHALEKVCRNCDEVGHLERACREMPAPRPAPNVLKRRISDEEKSSTISKKIAVVAKEEDEAEDPKPVSDFLNKA